MRPPFVNVIGGDWPTGTTPTPAMLRWLDQYASELVNGDDGGTWNPKQPIVVGIDPHVEDNSVRLAVGNGSLFSGSIETVKGNARQPHDPDLSLGIIVTGAPDDAPAPVFETARTRVLRVSFLEWTESSEIHGNGDARVAEPSFRLDPELLCPRGVMGAVGKRRNVACIGVPHRINHFAARIASVKFFFQIANRPTALPTNKPQFRIVRVDKTAGGLKMHTATGGYDGNGWLIDPALNVTDYFNDGNVRMLEFVPDEFNDDTDPSQYAYVLHFMDDDADIPVGAPGNAFLGAQIIVDQIPALRSE